MYTYIVLGGYLYIIAAPSVAPYRYLLPTVFLFVADIVNPALCVVVGPGFVSTSPAFRRNSASHPVWVCMADLPQKTVNRSPLPGAGFLTQCTQ